MDKWLLYCRKGDFAAIAEKFNISPMLARILVNRGLKTDEEIQTFIFASELNMHDPFKMKDMESAVNIMAFAIKNSRKIRIVGDYDVDGVCSSVILKKFLTYIGADCDVRIPNRVSDGYGLNTQMVDNALEDGISLIITCDNGISAYDAVKHANDIGIDTIITDHHEPPELLPPAKAVVDPKQNDCLYPYSNLCGAAISYKFDQALLQHIKNNKEFLMPQGHDIPEAEMLLNELMMFAGIATVTDIVPLTGENRVFAKAGIKRLKTTQNPGICALLALKEIDSFRIGTYHIGFIIGPCINSAGRLSDAKLAFDLLYTDDPSQALDHARILCDLNDRRKSITQKKIEEALEMIYSDQAYLAQKVMAIYLKDTHESVAGIIAGRLKDQFNRPVMVITDSKEGLKGSGRSTDDFNLAQALSRHKDLFIKYGGHAKACGFTLDCSVSEFTEAINSDPMTGDISFDKKIWIDMQLPFKYVTEEFIQELDILEPFGLDNDQPLFAEKNVRFYDIKVCGKNMNVLNLKLKDNDGTLISGVYFTSPESAHEEFEKIFNYLKEKGNDAFFSILYRPMINDFRNMHSLQAKIEGISFANS